jgi:hypothetical protein
MELFARDGTPFGPNALQGSGAGELGLAADDEPERSGDDDGGR